MCGVSVYFICIIIQTIWLFNYTADVVSDKTHQLSVHNPPRTMWSHSAIGVTLIWNVQTILIRRKFLLNLNTNRMGQKVWYKSA